MASSATKTAKPYWTPQREERLVKLYKQLKSKDDAFDRIARQMRPKTSDAIYKKCGRLGLLQAPWTKRYQ